MNKLLSQTTAVCYKRVAKPVLFLNSPDNVHKRTLKLGSKVQKNYSLLRMVNSAWSYQNPQTLAQTLNGIDFINPVGLSAGFDKNFELPPLMKAIGFGFMEGGSLTYRECQGNPRPWFHRLPKTKSIVVHVGLANHGVETIINRIKAYDPKTFYDFPLNISVAKTNSSVASTDDQAITDYIGSLKLLKKAGVGKLITLNISCPNTYGGEPFTTADRLDRLLSAADQVALSCPLFVKMPIDVSDKIFDELIDVIIAHQVAGVTIGNLAKDRTKIKLADPLPDNIEGNLSGKPTWELSNHHISRTYRHHKHQLTIIGVGGIFSAEDAYTKIRLGASLVELITGLIFEGPQLIGQINQGLDGLLYKDGFTHISQAIGIDA